MESAVCPGVVRQSLAGRWTECTRHAWLHAAPVAKRLVLATRAQREAEPPKLDGPFMQEPGCSADGMPLRTHAQVPSRTNASAAASVRRVEAFRTRLLDVRRVDLRGGCVKGVTHRSRSTCRKALRRGGTASPRSAPGCPPAGQIRLAEQYLVQALQLTAC